MTKPENIELDQAVKKDVLERAIQKALDNGWDFMGVRREPDFDWYVGEGQYGQLMVMNLFGGGLFELPTTIIFDHGFCKALWGDEYEQVEGAQDENEIDAFWWDDHGPVWKARLREMVIADDPIRYLGEHLYVL